MAGIGFQLKKMFEPDSWLDNLKAVSYSTTIASGPVFFSILCLALLGVFFRPLMAEANFRIFLISVVYIFAFSLITTGTVQLLLSRYLADLIYKKEFSSVVPVLSSSLLLVVTVQGIFGLPFFFLSGTDFLYRLTAFSLFIILGCIWVVMIFLSAIKNVRSIVLAFAAGVLISLVLGIVLGLRYDLTGLLHGYAIGQAVLLFVLLGRVLAEFRSEQPPDFSFIRFVKVLPQLVLTGLFFNTGIWIDKMIFWFGDSGEKLSSFLYHNPDYDSATFLAWLTTIPAYTYFLVRVETDFYNQFRSFFDRILSRKPLDHIVLQRMNIAASMRMSYAGMIKLQGVITLLCLLFSREIVAAFGLYPISSLIFEKVVIAVFLQMLLLTTFIFMMYFDIRTELVLVAGVFLLSNATLSWLSLGLDYRFYGYGFLAANFIALAFAWYFLDKHVQELEFRTFVQQPLG